MFPTLPSLISLPFSQPFKRASLGLFHGKTKQYGNNVPFSKHKTRRTWLPNSHSKRLYSEVMQGWIKTEVTARALKTIDKMGGIDNYLLNTRTDLLGYEGMRLRVMVRERKQQREAQATLETGDPTLASLGPSSASSSLSPLPPSSTQAPPFSLPV